MVAGAEQRAPFSVAQLGADAAGESEARILGERGNQSLEVIGLEREVGVELHHDVRHHVERFDASDEAANDRPAPHGTHGAAGGQRLHKWHALSETLGQLERVVGRAGIDDHPPLGLQGLALDTRGEAGQILELIENRSDQRVTERRRRRRAFALRRG